MPKDKIAIEKPDEKKHQLEKDRIRKDMVDQAKPKCRICGKYLYEAPQCFGHGGGGGGGGGGSSGESASKDGSKVIDGTPGKTTDTVTQAANVMKEGVADMSLGLQPQLGEKTFNPEVISELLSNKILVIDNDRDKGILAIKLQCHPDSLSVEQKNELKKFVNAILNELNEFKKENGISADCKTIEKDKDGNILSLLITLPTPILYDAFVQRLASKNLLPIQNIEQQAKEKVVYQEDINHFNPTPLSTKPTPSENRGEKSAEDEETHTIEKQGIPQEEKKSSSIHPKSPLDGLKPKGWE